MFSKKIVYLFAELNSVASKYTLNIEIKIINNFLFLEILLGYKITEENELLLLWKMQMLWRCSLPE